MQTMTNAHDDAWRLDAVACRAAAAIEAAHDAPADAAAVLRAYSAGDAARPAFDLYQRLREAEHRCAPRAPALARRLQRLGRWVERRGERDGCG
jgi:hypothetical protein